MFSQGFIEGTKDGLQTVRNFTYDAEVALDTGDTHEALKAMAFLVGQAINCQAVLAAKATYELLEEERRG